MSSHDIRHRVEFYEEPGGSKPVKDDARALGNSNPITAEHKVAAFDKMENPQYLHRHARHLQDGLFEWSIINSNDVRILFFHAEGRRLIIVHMFVKERQKLPPGDYTTALRRMTDWQERNTAPRGGKDTKMTSFREDLDELISLVGRERCADARLALEIATQFTALRERRNLSQRQLAERLGKTQQAVSKIENPTHGGHNLAKLKEAVSALNATLDVTIVPLEDVAAYDASRPPKPTLEDIGRRTAVERRVQPVHRRGTRHGRHQAPIKVSARTRSPKPRRNTTGLSVHPDRRLAEMAANG